MTLNTESMEESVVTPEETTEGVVQNAEDTVEVVEENATQVVEPIEDFTQILDKIFVEFEKDLENKNKDPEPEQEKFGPQISEPVHDSEAKVLLENLQKELDEKIQAEQAILEQNNSLIAELEAIKLEKEIVEKETQKQKTDIETMEEFYETLIKIPVLGELVQIVSTQGPDAVKIPEYLQEIMEAKMLAQTAAPSTEVSVIPEKKNTTSSFEQAIARRNRR